MNEEWRPIAGSNGYAVSNLGRVTGATARGQRILKPSPTSLGYFRVDVYSGGSKKTRKVHRLVAEAFIPNPLHLPHVNHIDGDKSNNRIDNLEWVTARENQVHASKIGLKACGEKVFGARLRESDIPTIITYAKTMLPKDIAALYGVDRTTINRVVSGRSWRRALKEASGVE